jgi:hypothetical protein
VKISMMGRKAANSSLKSVIIPGKALMRTQSPHLALPKILDQCQQVA